MKVNLMTISRTLLGRVVSAALRTDPAQAIEMDPTAIDFSVQFNGKEVDILKFVSLLEQALADFSARPSVLERVRQLRGDMLETGQSAPDTPPPTSPPPPPPPASTSSRSPEELEQLVEDAHEEVMSAYEEMALVEQRIGNLMTDYEQISSQLVVENNRSAYLSQLRQARTNMDIPTVMSRVGALGDMAGRMREAMSALRAR